MKFSSSFRYRLLRNSRDFFSYWYNLTEQIEQMEERSLLFHKLVPFLFETERTLTIIIQMVFKVDWYRFDNANSQRVRDSGVEMEITADCSTK